LSNVRKVEPKGKIRQRNDSKRMRLRLNQMIAGRHKALDDHYGHFV